MFTFKKPGRAGVGKMSLTDVAVIAAEFTCAIGLILGMRVLAG